MGTVNIIQHIMNNIIIVLVALATIVKAEVREDNIREMVENLEKEMKEAKNNAETFEKKIKKLNDNFDQKVKDMTDNFEKKLKAKDDIIAKIENKINSMNHSFGMEMKKFEREVSFLKEPPYSFFCGYRYVTSATSATITYNKLLYSSTSLPDSATLDINTGIFTSGWGGTYTVTWSGTAQDEAGDNFVRFYLRKNGEIISEAEHRSWYTGPSGRSDMVGGRTLLVRLDRGDTLDLWCEDCSAEMVHTIFCVTMSSYDPEYI